MKPPFVAPSDRILLAVESTLRAIDWTAAGFSVVPHIRHARRRFSTPDEYPCITIRWEQDEPRTSDQDDSYFTAGEMYVEMRITLEIEFEPSDGEDSDVDGADDDPTGLGVPSAFAFMCLRVLRDPLAELCRLWADGVSDRGRGEDPDSTPDEARFEQSIIVLYRVSTEDPSVLLAQGMNA